MVNRELEKNDYYFERELSEANLNIVNMTKKNSKRICQLEYKYFIYAYQTCFRPYTSSSDKLKFGYYFIYFKTKPKLTLFFPANSKNSYYFKESFTGERLYFIGADKKTTLLDDKND